MIPPKFREYAKAFLNIAKKDNIRAKRALELKDYPECFFYSQQSVEKSVKAMLEVKLIYKKEHDIIADASNNLQDLGNELDVVLNALDYLSGAWNISRYPFFNGNNITTPEEFVTEEMCRQGINYSDEVISIAENYLRKHGVI
ncbi:HEPN domain-containing protein [Saccharolobus islandicus]|uniref:HEPN domain protein n=1 Tax=Saccharolobus islandicus (strain M.16.4 / Kamchatka \|nr:HEPN domain-containing protein [Sulfolobus islandicus]ACR41663.1 HEPN domain protein [Sulfolobus islandicus M.16.4]